MRAEAVCAQHSAWHTGGSQQENLRKASGSDFLSSVSSLTRSMNSGKFLGFSILICKMTMITATTLMGS